MNPTEIYDALSTIAEASFDAEEFPFSFAEATDASQAAISKLRNGSTNKSDLPGGVLFGKRFYYAPAPAGKSDTTLEQLRASKKTKSSKPAILLATDGEMIAAEHTASGETLHCAFKELGDQFGFFLPAAGKERYRAVEENPVDVKATGKLAKLYDALIRANPDWGTDARRHEMNQLMMRLIFCMFAEDVGIFPEQQFSRLIFTYADDKGEEAHKVLIAAFQAMNLPRHKRTGLPAWTGELDYVNGGLFAGTIDAPKFDTIAFRYLREACGLDWGKINPDIFGSMIQSVADAKQRAELGMHYTSVPNIMKVIGPLFLDDLDVEIHKGWDRARALQQTLSHMSHIRVFDPACGSGNFLVVSYRELRARETRIMQRLEELDGRNAMSTSEMFSRIKIDHFYGIEISDFAAETAKLALFIAEYQANASFKTVFGRCPAALPLRDAARIHTGNALRLNWEEIFPPPTEGEEVFIAGNPPFIWSNEMSTTQKGEMKSVFSEHIKSYGILDYVSSWYFKSKEFIHKYGGKSALVATSAICQGQSVPALWPLLLDSGIEIFFAYRPFPWSNNASNKATVDVVVIGLQKKCMSKKLIFDADTKSIINNISPYITPTDNIIVIPSRKRSIFGLPIMVGGCKPIDGGNLIFSTNERNDVIKDNPQTENLFKKFMGADELIKGIERWCLFIDDRKLPLAQSINDISIRIDKVKKTRENSSDSGARSAAIKSHQFREHSVAKNNAIVIPAVSSERRPYLTPVFVGSDTVISNRNYVIYDQPVWILAILSSLLHRVWILTVCGKLQARPNYSNTLGWNTFPVPKFTDEQLEALSASARRILKCRYSHYPKTIADLYDPDKMPDDLRAVHKENDDLLESMYIGRPFRNDTERLETLFKLYAAKIKTLETASKKKKA
ncbi:class I SAM-dependent DNA methyltransferase [Gluconobacter thailandicus]|uniref:site-specific DNA-methyltransferase (adenine-specific) n=1 Tax=Gluconobacter thailandicus TaxID=257438 RepID=A0AAP9JJ38_GLUTH|nr:DNA methyltransferase [Gluconobacter thailandicus]QEH97907.1 class I SAM-dependent DNA methyltransferase [Gluconobacter thailandicus]